MQILPVFYHVSPLLSTVMDMGLSVCLSVHLIVV